MNNCEHKELKFEGWLGAPGHGQSHKCVDCGESLWSPNGYVKPIPFKYLDHDDFILSAEDVI
jgi:hypothetical protein